MLFLKRGPLSFSHAWNSWEVWESWDQWEGHWGVGFCHRWENCLQDLDHGLLVYVELSVCLDHLGICQLLVSLFWWQYLWTHHALWGSVLPQPSHFLELGNGLLCTAASPGSSSLFFSSTSPLAATLRNSAILHLLSLSEIGKTFFFLNSWLSCLCQNPKALICHGPTSVGKGCLDRSRNDLKPLLNTQMIGSPLPQHAPTHMLLVGSGNVLLLSFLFPLLYHPSSWTLSCYSLSITPFSGKLI